MTGARTLAATVPADAPAPLAGETAWFPGSQHPVQVGVYRRLSAGGTTVYSYFDGAHWLWNTRSINQAARMSSTEPSLAQCLPWCGLVLPPPQGYGPMGAASDSEGGEPC